MSSRYDEAIDRGIALLDQKIPEWCHKMQLDHLDMADGKSCVLGQLFEAPENETGFGQGCSELAITSQDCRALGFTLHVQAEYCLLTRRWKQRIRQHCEAHS